MSSENRLIIGETERAGWPISAPVGNRPSATIRWRKADGYFALEQFMYGEWREVMCSVPPTEPPTPPKHD